MARSVGSDARGGAFTQAVIQAVWGKAKDIPNYNLAVWRQDPCGKPIKRSDHGDTKSQYGWEIDHIKPVAKGGADDLANLQALQWENNRTKGDSSPWRCP